ncbi:PstS family phosphate ABC transporter substrate-binding protein [Nitrospira moscoviensis]|nr:PstS family phosphate ABC transporter substrate-binding protein [Nitrospira moscoviensis]
MLAPSGTSGQVRPELDPLIPPYQFSEAVTGKFSVAGSDSMKPLIQAWVEELRRRHPGVHIAIDSAGSQTGLQAVLEHRAEVAAMSRRMTAKEIGEFVREYGYEPTEIPVAVDAMAIFVHRDNPVAGLSLEELDSIFCVQRRRGLSYVVDSWGLVGLMDEWFDAPIHLYGRNGNSGTSYFFREEVCKGGSFRPQMVNGDGSASVVLDVMNDRQGIGFSAVGYRTSMVRPVPIAAVKGGRYVKPTFENAMNGTYPLRRHLYLYLAQQTNQAPSPPIARLVQFALSAQGQQLALDHGYFPLTLQEITRLQAKWSAVKAALVPTTPRPAN